MKRAPMRWIQLALGLVIAVQGGLARAADAVAREPSEADDAFMARVLGGASELAQKVIRSTELAKGKTTLIGFVTVDEQPLVGHLLIETTAGHYQHLQFPSCGVEGGAPELLAVFFARTVANGDRDLAVLCKWEVNHAEVDGALYAAEFYRLEDGGPKMTVEPLTDLNAKFNTTDTVSVEEHGKRHREKAKFKTVADVKKLLTKMGIKQ